MSPLIISSTPDMGFGNGHKSDRKKRKREKLGLPAEDEVIEETPRKHKKSRSVVPTEEIVEVEQPSRAGDDLKKKKNKKKKKEKKSAEFVNDVEEENMEVVPVEEMRKKKKRSKDEELRFEDVADVVEDHLPHHIASQSKPEQPGKKKQNKSKGEGLRFEDAVDVGEDHQSPHYIASQSEPEGVREAEQPEKKKKKKKKNKDEELRFEHAADAVDDQKVPLRIASQREPEGAIEAEQPEKKKKRRRERINEDERADRHVEDGDDQEALPESAVDDTLEQPEKDAKHKGSGKDEKKGRDEKKRKKRKDSPPLEQEVHVDTQVASPAEVPMDIDNNVQSSALSGVTSQKSVRFPFFTQCISLYVPLYPKGFDKPLSSIASQHLDPLLNRYSSALRGMLLSYTNVNISDRPQRADARNPPTDATPATLYSRDEYAVGFGYLTADMTLFIPSRGSYLEGEVKLQNEGNIGVVCFNLFNASIEAKRLNKAWKWVDLTEAGGLLSSEFGQGVDNEENGGNVDGDAVDGGEVQQDLHSTGYWVDENGDRVSGKLLFRISSWDTGTASDYQYLSIKGTMLDEEEEKALVAEERGIERKRRAKQNPLGLLRPLARRLPEFSITKFGQEEENEDDGKPAMLYKGGGASGNQGV